MNRKELWDRFKDLELEFGALSNIFQNDVPVSVEEQEEWKKRLLYFKSDLVDFELMVENYFDERRKGV